MTLAGDSSLLFFVTGVDVLLGIGNMTRRRNDYHASSKLIL
jgi:hypothetical protein